MMLSRLLLNTGMMRSCGDLARCPRGCEHAPVISHLRPFTDGSANLVGEGVPEAASSFSTLFPTKCFSLGSEIQISLSSNS